MPGSAAGASRRGITAWLPLLTVLVLAALFADASGWTHDLSRPERRIESDFEILYAAGSALRAGDDPHDQAVLDAQGARVGRAVTPFSASPPLVTALFALLARLDFEDAYELWLAFGALFVVASALLLANALRRTGVDAALALAIGAALVLLSDATWMSLAMNSTNALALVALSLAVAAGCRGRTRLEGAALAVAIVAKTSPALVFVPLALGGRWRTLRAASLTLLVLAGASLLTVGWDVHRSWIEHVLPALGYAPDLPPGAFDNGRHAWNLAPHGILARAAVEADLPRGAVKLGAWMVSVLVLAQLVLGARGLRRRVGVANAKPKPNAETEAETEAEAEAETEAEAEAEAEAAREVLHLYGMGVAATFLVSSVTWPHHLVFAAIPGAALVARWGTRRTLSIVGLAACVALALPLGLLRADGSQPPAILLQTAACVVLFASLAARPAEPAAGR